MLSLTDSGRERFDRIENDMDMKFRKVLSGIETEKREQVLEALRLYNEACRKAECKCE